MNPPCKDCITFAICKNQMQSYLESNNPTNTALGLMQELDPKCKLIAIYIQGLTKEAKSKPGYKLIPFLHKITREIFL